jgi:hypothetical protein
LAEVIEPVAVPYKTPDVGRVTLVVAVEIRVVEKAPLVVNAPAVVMLPPRVMVLDPLFTPVPPYVPVINCPFQVAALPIVPLI